MALTACASHRPVVTKPEPVYCYERGLTMYGTARCADILLRTEDLDDRVILCVDTWRQCIELGRLREWARQAWAVS